MAKVLNLADAANDEVDGAALVVVGAVVVVASAPNVTRVGRDRGQHSASSMTSRTFTRAIAEPFFG